jgi:prophage tail gpP-like protein
MSILIELDERRRASLGRIGRHSRYLAREEPDGTLIFEPAVVLTEAEQRYLDNEALVAQVEDNRAHPERRRPRPERPRG